MEPVESDTERSPTESSVEYPLPEMTVLKSKRFRFPITIEPIVFSLFLSDTLSESVIQNFILMRTCTNHFHYNQSICNQLAHPKENISDLLEKVQPYSAEILTAMNFLSKLFPAFLSLFLGSWSDYNGRKFIMLLPVLGYCFQYLLMIGFSFLPKLGPEYGLLVVLPVALTGSFTNFITGVYSYISDISTEENRSFRLSLIESVMYCSVYIGLMSSSHLLKAGGTYGFVLVYGICVFNLVITVIPTYFFVPESVQVTEDRRGVSKIFDFGLLKEMFRVCCKKRENRKRSVIFLVMTCLTISIGTLTGESNVLYLYTKLRFGWDIPEYTFWASVVLASSFFGLLFGSAVFTKFLKIPDVIVGTFSYGFKALSTFYTGFIPSSSPNLMYYNGFFSFFNGLCGPVGRSILSKSVPKEELGKIFALLGTTEAIFPLAMGPLFTILYNYTIHTEPNAFLLLSGSFFVLCTFFYIIVCILQKSEKEVEHERLRDVIVNE